ncbi:hypothetical protein I3760_03G022100 [Carya illinoinensis]|uniref:Glutaredoxin domain-containing protein n=1 Tax=Carya illinoinensis TaxID=32201 RepID=A0A8T1QYX0_CARIL|nr:uncharacterized protein At3g28850 [Carya illinoinensis]KAG2714341.1 hypothetical protein I3760_03G022100 [Carya illinoinensis]KAG6659354.1 hypothetical protein CIPAW_03G028700 [Carya illinoinensis]KAG6719773.1 hypothetical protein I3842_03G023600 [Carya illinoinensis]
MGCASSKQKRCRHCRSPYSPAPRSYSMHIHHPPQSQGDSYHVVALTSSTLGSIKLEPSTQINHFNNKIIDVDDDLTNGDGNYIGYVEDNQKKSKEFALGLIEAKTWSNMIEEKIPKTVPRTPIRTPPGEPETINIWELMEGLEDVSPLRSPNHFRSFSFDVVRSPNSIPVDIAFDRPKSRFQGHGTASPKPTWLHMGGDDADSVDMISQFDPQVISTFRKSLQELPPDNPFHLRSLDNDKHQEQESAAEASNDLPLDVDSEKKVNAIVVSDYKCGKDKVVVYFTSLRGVRKTYEDCCHVRVIIKGLGIRVDERDMSMHSGFKEELKELLGDEFNGGGLPRVFVGKKYIGGAEEIRRLHEDGRLEKVVECCERVDDGAGVGGPGLACEACGDIRFVPCETCSGSCKIYYERDEEEEEECGDEEGEYGFQRCPDCNENGLIRCPICCY